MADDDAASSRANDRSSATVAGNGSDDRPIAADAHEPSGTDASGGGGDDALERLRAELEDAKDKLLRERAELENYKKRATREKAEAMRYGSEALLRDLLPVIDNLERALAHARAAVGAVPIVEGVELVLRSLIETLERHGVRAVEARGARFDPSVHEAIGHVESAEPPNTVVDEHQRGYALHDRLLRPALVTVGKGPTTAEGPPRVESTEDDG